MITFKSIVLLVAALAMSACDNKSVVPVTNDFALRTDMRTLWVAHSTWTRVVIIDMAAGLPDTGDATARLLQNQVDIGNAIKPFYGEAAGNQLTSLLHDHITGAAALITAAKAGDTAGVATARTAWYANADAIAAFLAHANPNWPLADLTTMMHTHLDQTLAEATARLTGDAAGDVVAYDAVNVHMLHMADTLAAGITTQFPDLVSTSTMPVGDQNLHLAMRELWQEHVTWTRVFLIDDVAGLPSTPQSTARLLQNQVDIGNAIKPFYGDAAGNMLTSLLHDHITGAAAVVTAAKAGDAMGLASARTAWYANADSIATFLAGANPNWPVADLTTMMHTHLDQTLLEASSRITADWATDITTFDMVVMHILDMADTLSGGIAAQFTVQVG